MKTIKVKAHHKVNKTTGRIILIKEFIRQNRKRDTSKQDIIRFVIKKLELKDKDRVKKISNLIYKTLSKKLETKRDERKIKEEALKDTFDFYYGNGNKLDLTSMNKMEVGDVFYNQKINSGESWKETLKRKGLKILSIVSVDLGAINQDKGKKFIMNIMTPEDNGKKLKVVKKAMYAVDVFDLLKKEV